MYVRRHVRVCVLWAMEAAQTHNGWQLIVVLFFLLLLFVFPFVLLPLVFVLVWEWAREQVHTTGKSAHHATQGEWRAAQSVHTHINTHVLCTHSHTYSTYVRTCYT